MTWSEFTAWLADLMGFLNPLMEEFESTIDVEDEWEEIAHEARDKINPTD